MSTLMEQALSGSRGDDQKRIALAVEDFGDTLLRKNKDYGSSVWQAPVLLPELDHGDAILVRMGDKINRIQSLAKQPAEVADETLRDTIKDLGAYCLLWLARPAESGDKSECHTQSTSSRIPSPPVVSDSPPSRRRTRDSSTPKS